MKQPSVLLLSLLAAAAAVIVYFGLADKKLLFINTPRAAAISLVVVGFLMCSLGALQLFVTKAPTHPFAFAGYLLGLVALLTSVSQIFRIDMPLVGEPKTAIIVLGSVILAKFIIGRLSALITLKA